MTKPVTDLHHDTRTKAADAAEQALQQMYAYADPK